MTHGSSRNLLLQTTILSNCGIHVRYNFPVCTWCVSFLAAEGTLETGVRNYVYLFPSESSHTIFSGGVYPSNHKQVGSCTQVQPQQATSYHLTSRPKNTTPPKTNMDTQNDGLEKVYNSL